MKIEEIVFPTDDGKIYRPLHHILNNKWDPDKIKSVSEEIAAKSQTVDEFIDTFIADKRTHNSLLYAELLRCERPEKKWYAIREMFGERCFKTFSDVGALLIGNSDFCVAIQNNFGDGITRVAVFNEDDEFNHHLMEYEATVKGSFGIFDYDCAGIYDKPIRELSGNYFVYSFEGLIAFVKVVNGNE